MAFILLGSDRDRDSGLMIPDSGIIRHCGASAKRVKQIRDISRLSRIFFCHEGDDLLHFQCKRTATHLLRKSH